MTLGQRIKELRLQQGLTQRQLAEMTEVDFTYLSKIENDRLEHTPSIQTLQRFAQVLHVDELELMDLADKVPSSLQVLVENKEALRFMRRASQTLKTPEQWKALYEYLEREKRNSSS